MKTCTKCGESKPLDAFDRATASKEWLRGACRLCVRDQKKQWRETNRARKRETDKRWSEANLERKRMTTQRWSKANPEKCRAHSKAWKEANREKSLANTIVQNRTKRALLKPDYVACALRMPVADLTPELLAAKRQALTLHRLSKTLKTAIKETTK